MTASTDWQHGVNWMTKASVASTCVVVFFDRLETLVSTHLPSSTSTSRWRPGGPETPTGNPRHTILSRSALSDLSTPAPARKEVSRYRATKWKWTAPSKSSRERSLSFYSFSLLRTTKNLNRKRKRRIFLSYGPLGPPTNEVMTHACVHMNF